MPEPLTYFAVPLSFSDNVGVPDWVIAIGAQYDHTFMAKYDAYVRADYQYTGKYDRTTGVGTTSYNYFFHDGDVTRTINARAGVSVDKMEVALFVQNLTNSNPGVRVHRANNGGWGVQNFLQRDATFDQQLGTLDSDLVVVAQAEPADQRRAPRLGGGHRREEENHDELRQEQHRLGHDQTTCVEAGVVRREHVARDHDVGVGFPAPHARPVRDGGRPRQRSGELDVDRRRLEMPKTLKDVGEYDITYRAHPEVIIPIKLAVHAQK